MNGFFGKIFLAAIVLAFQIAAFSRTTIEKTQKLVGGIDLILKILREKPEIIDVWRKRVPRI